MSSPSHEDLFRTGGGAAALAQIDETHWQRLIGLEVGAYRLTELIGSGGMSVVYRAQRSDGTIERDVAIKFLRLIQAGDHMLQEARAVAALRHPNIVSLLDLGRWDDGTPYLVLELIDGETLDRYLDRERPALQARLALWLKLCDAVSTAHARFVAHRDIKPANILVSADGEPHLVDFGIASELHGNSPDLARGVGTPYYSAPEVICGVAETSEAARVDQFALGMLLAELLLERRPARIDAADVAGSRLPRLHAELPQGAELSAMARRMRVSIGQLKRAFRGALGDIVERATQGEPQARYPGVAAMADDLRAWRAHRPLTARPRGPGYRLGLWLLRYRWPVSAALLLLSLGLAFTISTVLQSRRTEVALTQAQTERDRAESINGLLRELFINVDPAESGTREITLLQAIRRLEPLIAQQLHREPEVEAEMRLLTGTALRALEDNDNARAMLQRAMALAGDDARGLEVRRRAAVQMAILIGNLGEVESAAALLSRLHDPAEEPATWGRVTIADVLAVIHQLSGRRQHSHDLMDWAERMASRLPYDPSDREAFHAWAMHRLLSLQFARESGELQKAMDGAAADLPRIRESMGDPSLMLGNFLLEYGTAANAAGILDQAVRANRDAISVYDQALGVGSTLAASATYQLGLTAQLAGEPDRARQLYLDALRIQTGAGRSEHPEVSSILFLLADLDYAEGHYDEALVRFERGEQLIGALMQQHAILRLAMSRKALIIAAQGDLEAAGQLLDRLTDLQQSQDGENQPALMALAVTRGEFELDHRGDPVAAIRSFRHALGMLPDDAPAFLIERLRAELGLIRALQRAGDQSAAASALDRVLARRNAEQPDILPYCARFAALQTQRTQDAPLDCSFHIQW